ncbi:MAG: sigma-70 family RNA polymerase sigma factor [Lachnospiraceae bacterium]|jgi:RNA polymerase sporulation-specific sigma factor|nr:sigma-70 family RNA polymerase sigma factor [Lachnospiraceae bacterium]
MTNPYENYPDEALLARLRAGETQITEYLMEKYKDLVRSKARTMYLLGADAEDLIQEGMIGLFKAIRDYEPGSGAAFATFANICIARQMYTAIEAAGRHKHYFLNTYISLYASAEDGEISAEDMRLINTAKSPDRSPEELLIERENAENLEKIIAKALSKFEKQVFDLHLVGLGYAEIAAVLGKSGKATDNALQRVRMKVKKALEGNE